MSSATAAAPLPPESAARPTPSPPLPGTATGWVDAARSEQWEEVARLIDRLDPKAREVGALRYVRARAALRLGDHARAARLLERLEADLPALSSEIARDRAAAVLTVGPYADAARYYAGLGTAEGLAQAALAWERAGDPGRALTTASRAIELASRTRELQARARAVRARVAETLGRHSLALADWRWLAKAAPTTAAADEAAERLASLAPLTTIERYQRGMAFAQAGDARRAEAELETKAPGPPLPPNKVYRLRGWARYLARTESSQAADWLEKAARAGGEEAVRDLFHAARARSRAQDDERAIRLYLELATRYPRSPYAEEARYLAARLAYVLGQWEKASRAYTSYLGRFGRQGRFADAARYERAVSWLVAGKGPESVEAFRELLADSAADGSRARQRELYAVALLTAGKTDAARQELRRVVREAPLSFAALISARRLAELGDPRPLLIEPPASAVQRAALEIELPPKARLLHELGLDADAERALFAYEPELRRKYGARADEALCQAYGRLLGGARRLNAGQRAVRAGELDQAPSPGTRWLWECVYPQPYRGLVRALEAEHTLPSSLVYALIRQESGFRTEAESEAGAVGLMQLLPATAAKAASELGISAAPQELNRPPVNLRVGAFYLARVWRKFGKNVPLALAAYNAGPQNVAHWLESGEKLALDLFVARIPFAETRHYVHRVVGNLARYAYLDGGPAALPELDLELPQGIRATADDY